MQESLAIYDWKEALSVRPFDLRPTSYVQQICDNYVSARRTNRSRSEGDYAYADMMADARVRSELTDEVFLLMESDPMCDEFGKRAWLEMLNKVRVEWIYLVNRYQSEGGAHPDFVELFGFEFDMHLLCRPPGLYDWTELNRPQLAECELSPLQVPEPTEVPTQLPQPTVAEAPPTRRHRPRGRGGNRPRHRAPAQ